MPVGPAPGLLPKDIHRDCRENHRHGDTADHEEAVAHALHSDPVVAVKGHAEREEILDEVHDRKRLGRLLPVAVDDVRDDAGRAQLNAEVDKTQTDDHRHRPGGLDVECLAPGKETRCGKEKKA